MGDFERLLGGREFNGCFCALWTSHDETWQQRCKEKPQENLEHTRAKVRRGEHVGFLATRIVDGAVVGWISAGPKPGFSRFKEWPGGRLGPQDEAAWCIGCLAVGFAYRGLGYSRRMVDLAVEEARSAGASAVEAFPTEPGDEGSAWKGSRRLYEAAGFEPADEEPSGERKVVRMVKKL